MSAEIIMFVPKPNPNRPTLSEADEIAAANFLDRAPALIGTPTDCGNAIWPWPEKDGA